MLTSSSGSSMDVVAKLSDFGFAKDCSHDSQSTLSAEYVTDDSNWMAPELLFPQNASEETDIYSLGCVYFYTLTHGAYFKTNSGALSSRKDHLSMLACALIGRMTKHEAGNRISSQDVTRNPLFWNADKVLNFIVDVSNRLENREMNEEIREEIRYIEADVVRENWYTKLDTPVVDALKARRSYDGSSMQDLVRAIRNLRLHYDVCSAEFRRFVGKLPEEYLNYWLRLFPNLVLSLYIIADRHLSQDITFHNLYLK
ncbi:Serine/threonine-protein kinase/endoribonuclease IRE1 [Pseudolycoriella hygida]|uniref:Serine/threonine-protein kinase/endoribonuclease IRE1 n=1 Tax=Pseudolycoriella hygida TaxID=35572 RepID=A0A9Q0NFN0_9DIPT|nr:Serine/threonine-protein kinase/endoribonuclease IRE1 [Pseudolycoriella hygida]